MPDWLAADGLALHVQLGGRGPRLQYDGQWWQGRREGKGTRFYFNGETYSGAPGNCQPTWDVCTCTLARAERQSNR